MNGCIKTSHSRLLFSTVVNTGQWRWGDGGGQECYKWLTLTQRGTATGIMILPRLHPHHTHTQWFIIVPSPWLGNETGGTIVQINRGDGDLLTLYYRENITRLTTMTCTHTNCNCNCNNSAKTYLYTLPPIYPIIQVMFAFQSRLCSLPSQQAESGMEKSAIRPPPYAWPQRHLLLASITYSWQEEERVWHPLRCYLRARPIFALLGSWLRMTVASHIRIRTHNLQTIGRMCFCSSTSLMKE